MLFILGGLTAVTYLLVGIVAGTSPMTWEESSTADQVLWIVILVGGGLLLVAGLWLVKRSPWVGAALISLGGVVGASAIWWSGVAILLVIALVVLSVINARQITAAT